MKWPLFTVATASSHSSPMASQTVDAGTPAAPHIIDL